MELAPKNFQDFKLLHSTLFVCIPRDLKPGSDIKRCILDATSSGMALSGQREREPYLLIMDGRCYVIRSQL
jgi:hypothetical protein